MPTQVSIAKQCLSEAAAGALDEAVSVARRRGHPQTTSLHAVSALFSDPSSTLLEACLRARNTAFYPPAQFKVLDFCLSLALDRLPTSQARVDEPPIANSLMAAIKRAQANQKRQADIHSNSVSGSIRQQLLQQQHGHEQGGLGIQVETRHLIFAILDDPIVSRVFNEAGFNSFHVKLAIIRPLQSFLRCPRIRRPSTLYMCSLELREGDGHTPFSFPFPGFWSSCGWNDNSRRIGEVLAKNRGRNPLLIGAFGSDALGSFMEAVERSENVLPLEIRGLNMISVEKELLKMVRENWSEKLIDLWFEELGSMAGLCFGAGLVVSVGELKVLVGADDAGTLNVLDCVVRKFTKLLDIHSGRVWLIGSAATYDIYLKLLDRFPSVDQDWDLQLLPITSLDSTTGSYLKSSLTGSFVPFGGFFSYPSSLTGSIRNAYEQDTCFQLCEDKCEQEVSAGFPASVVDQCKTTTLPPSLNISETGTTDGTSVLKDNANLILTGVKAGLQNKRDIICPHLHKNPCLETDNSCELTITRSNVWVGESGKNAVISTSVPVRKHSLSKLGVPTALKNLTLELPERPLETEQATIGLGSPYSLANSSLGDGETSPQGGSCVTTSLGLGTYSQSYCVERRKSGKHDFKRLFEELFRRVGRQEEAIKVISRRVTCPSRKNGSVRGSYTRSDLWLCFLGADVFGKKKIASALAELLCGSKDRLVSLDLGLGSDHEWRGKTAVDFIAEGLRKAPLSVVFLENFECAPPPAKSSLLQAMVSSKLSDSCGREVGTSNAIFLLASRFSKMADMTSPSAESTSNFPEERITKAKNWPTKLSLNDGTAGHARRQELACKRKPDVVDESANDIYVSRSHGKRHPCKRRNVCQLDLNLAAESEEADEETNPEDNSIPASSLPWLEAVMNQVDETILFEPFDYNGLATKVLKSIGTRGSPKSLAKSGW